MLQHRLAQKRFYLKHKLEILEKRKKLYQKHKSEILKKAKERYYEHSDELLKKYKYKRKYNIDGFRDCQRFSVLKYYYAHQYDIAIQKMKKRYENRSKADLKKAIKRLNKRYKEKEKEKQKEMEMKKVVVNEYAPRDENNEFREREFNKLLNYYYE